MRRFEAAFELIDVGPAGHLALGDAFLAQGRRAEAVAEFETARDLAPGQPEPLARLAAAYEADGRWADAAGALAQLSQAGAATPEDLYRLAVLTAATDPATAGARLAVAAEVPSVHQAQARHLLDAVTSATGQSDASECDPQRALNHLHSMTLTAWRASLFTRLNHADLTDLTDPTDLSDQR